MDKVKELDDIRKGLLELVKDDSKEYKEPVDRFEALAETMAEHHTHDGVRHG